MAAMAKIQVISTAMIWAEISADVPCNAKVLRGVAWLRRSPFEVGLPEVAASASRYNRGCWHFFEGCAHNRPYPNTLHH